MFNVLARNRSNGLGDRFELACGRVLELSRILEFKIKRDRNDQRSPQYPDHPVSLVSPKLVLDYCKHHAARLASGSRPLIVEYPNPQRWF